MFPWCSRPAVAGWPDRRRWDSRWSGPRTREQRSGRPGAGPPTWRPRVVCARRHLMRAVRQRGRSGWCRAPPGTEVGRAVGVPGDLLRPGVAAAVNRGVGVVVDPSSVSSGDVRKPLCPGPNTDLAWDRWNIGFRGFGPGRGVERGMPLGTPEVYGRDHVRAGQAGPAGAPPAAAGGRGRFGRGGLRGSPGRRHSGGPAGRPHRSGGGDRAGHRLAGLRRARCGRAGRDRAGRPRGAAGGPGLPVPFGGAGDDRPGFRRHTDTGQGVGVVSTSRPRTARGPSWYAGRTGRSAGTARW